MFSFPNSLPKLCDKARNANFPAAKELVVLFPRMDAVAPVKMSVPLAPFSSRSFSLKANIASRENAKEALMLTVLDSSMSASVRSRNGFQVPDEALNTATRIEYSGAG